MDDDREEKSSHLLGEPKLRLVLSCHVRRISIGNGGELARVRESCGGPRVRGLEREEASHRSGVSPGRVLWTGWTRIRLPVGNHGNFDFTACSPIPVGSRPAGTSRWGVMELIGNGWELTDTPFAPFPGFSPYIESYPDYSRDFFDGKHFVLKGASWATPADLIRPGLRNWYQAHYPYVFAKFRCVSEGSRRSL